MPIVCMENVQRYYGDNPQLLARYREIVETGECPFCEGNIGNGHQFVGRTKHWNIVINPYPYPNSVVHLLVIPKRHLESLEELSLKEWGEMAEVITVAIQRYPVLSQGYGLAIRVREIGGVTLYHLHMHLIAPKGVVGFGIG